MQAIYRIFLKGLFAVLPLAITIYFLLWLAAAAEGTLGEPLQEVLPNKFYIPGMGVAVGVLLIFLIGLFVNSYVTSQFVEWLEHTIQKVPFVKAIYNPLRDVMNLFGQNQKQTLKRVVMVDISPGNSVIGLVTRDRFDELAKPETLPQPQGSSSSAVSLTMSPGASTAGSPSNSPVTSPPAQILAQQLKNKIVVFVPYSFAVGGMSLLVDKDLVHELDIPVEKALQLAITGWIKSDSPKGEGSRSEKSQSNAADHITQPLEKSGVQS